MSIKENRMPMHDWTRVSAGSFHTFHTAWITEIARALNNGVLPDGFYAESEQVAGQTGPDVLTLDADPNWTVKGRTDALESRSDNRRRGASESQHHASGFRARSLCGETQPAGHPALIGR